MRVLITGAAGFIGSHLVRVMAKQGADVVALVRPNSDLRRLEDVLDQVTIASSDLLDEAGLRSVIEAHPPELCIHLAWFIAPGEHPNSLRNFDYVSGSMRLLQILDSVGCKRTVITGTCLEQDTSLGHLAEDTPILPQNFYSACKHSLNIVARAFQQRQGRGFAWVRLFNTYGPEEYDGPLVPDVIRKLLLNIPCELTAGTQQRDFLHVKDVARAISAIALSGVSATFNVGSGTPVAVSTIAKTIGTYLDREQLLLYGARSPTTFDCPICYANPRRLTQLTGWKQQIGLEEGLAETVEWWRSILIPR